MLRTDSKEDYLCLYDGDKIILKISVNKNGNAIDIKKLFLFMNYTLEDALKIALFNALKNADLNSNDIYKKEDIGMDDNEFYIALELINQINKQKNKNIILKLFNYYPNGVLNENYFSIKKDLKYKQFLLDIGLKELSIKNKIIILPLSIYYHFSLLLIYNGNMHVIDFGLYYVVDDYSQILRKELNDLDNEITTFINSNNYDSITIWNIIDKYGSIDKIKPELKNMIKEDDKREKFIELIENYYKKFNESNDVFILKDNPRLDIRLFNDDLSKNIKVLNLYSIQGKQSCSYLCLAAFKLITNKEYNFNDLIELFKDAKFQIMSLKILFEEFLQDKQKIFIINENIEKNDYNIYMKEKNKIGIKKCISNILIINPKNQCNEFSLKKEFFIDEDSIKNMLIDNGYVIID